MLTLVHVSDLHFGRRRDSAAAHDKALLEMLGQKYSFATSENTYLLVTGDLVDGEEPRDWAKQWRDVQAALAPFKGRLLVCPGNHDLGIPGTLVKYRELCAFLGVSGAGYVPGCIGDGTTIVKLLGIDSTWAFPGLGIAGIGHVARSQSKAVDRFVAEPGIEWKMLYLHHRPVEPTISEGAKKAMDDGKLTALAEHLSELKDLVCSDFMALVNADDLLASISGKLDIMAFGHDKCFGDDVHTSQPVWVNSNREDTTTTGWVELRFEGRLCDIVDQSADGTIVGSRRIVKP